MFWGSFRNYLMYLLFCFVLSKCLIRKETLKQGFNHKYFMWEVILENTSRGMGKWDNEGKEANKRCFIKQVITVGNQSSSPRGTLGVSVWPECGTLYLKRAGASPPIYHWLRAASERDSFPSTFGLPCSWAESTLVARESPQTRRCRC